MPDPTPTAQRSPRARAEALPPEERRARIVTAAEPLLLAHGAGATTKQIADAAGIAEGTIFRVFPDKDALIDAVVESITEVTSLIDALDDIDRSLPLAERLEIAVDVVRARMAKVFAMAAALGPRVAPGKGDGTDERARARLAALAAVFEPDAAQLRTDPLRAAQALHGLTIASTHPLLSGDEPLTSAEVVSLLLDGLRNPPQEPPC